MKLADVHAALTYFYDHQTQIYREWQEARDTIAALRSQYPSKLHK